MGGAGQGALVRIRSTYSALAPAEQKVADYVLSAPQEAIYSSVTELAEASGVGEATVIRFCRDVGYRGVQEFKLVLAADLAAPAEGLTGDIGPEDDLAAAVQKVSHANRQAIGDTVNVLDLEQLDKAAEAIAAARKVEFYGVGASGITALDAKYKFMRIGRACEAFSDPHLAAMSASLLQPGDVAVGISHSGSTKDVVDALREARKSGATIVCLTDHARSPITAVADVVLLTASREAPLASGALRSKIAQVHLLDLLFTGVVMKLRDQARESTRRTAQAVVDKLY